MKNIIFFFAFLFSLNTFGQGFPLDGHDLPKDECQWNIFTQSDFEVIDVVSTPFGVGDTIITQDGVKHVIGDTTGIKDFFLSCLGESLCRDTQFIYNPNDSLLVFYSKNVFCVEKSEPSSARIVVFAIVSLHIEGHDPEISIRFCPINEIEKNKINIESIFFIVEFLNLKNYRYLFYAPTH